MILCDIGNTRMHFFQEGRVFHLSHEEGMARFKEETVWYICVNAHVSERIVAERPHWREITGQGLLKSPYRGLGIDREAACLGVYDGIVVDAGSAITVDVMDRGVHLGGWIWPGLRALRRAYASVSPRLDRPLDPDNLPAMLPHSTDEALAFAVFGAIAETIGKVRGEKRVVVTGGDAERIAAVIRDAVIDETVVFEGMKKMLKDQSC